MANTGKTITLGGNLTTSGANALTITTTGATNVTLPTTGTVVTEGSAALLYNKTIYNPATVFFNAAFTRYFGFAGTNLTDNRTLEFPDAAGTIVADTATQTLTNKTLTTPILTGDVIQDVVKTSGSSGVAIKNSGGTTVVTFGSANTTNVSFAGVVNMTSPNLTTPVIGVATGTSLSVSSNLIAGSTSITPIQSGSLVSAQDVEITKTVTSDGDSLGQTSYVNNTNAGIGSGASFNKIVSAIKGLMVGTGNNSGGLLTFFTKSDGGSLTEAMRIDGNQNVGIGGTANTNAILDAQSTTKAFMPPRMTTTQKNNIASPTAGMVVYDSTLNKLCVRTSAAWETITSV